MYNEAMMNLYILDVDPIDGKFECAVNEIFICFDFIFNEPMIADS